MTWSDVGHSLLPLLSFFGGAGVAILSAWLGPAIQRRAAAEETARLHKRMLLEKAEEIYVEIDRVRSEARRHLTTTSVARSGLPSELPPYVVGDLGRLRGLVYLHFPSARQLIKGYDIAIAQRVKAVTESPEGNAIEKLNELAVAGYKATTIFLDILQDEVAHSAAALHLVAPRTGDSDSERVPAHELLNRTLEAYDEEHSLS